MINPCAEILPACRRWPGDFIMYPHAVGGYTPTWSLFDYYGGGGFSHEEKHYISKFTSLYIWGQFKQVTADPQYP